MSRKSYLYVMSGLILFLILLVFPSQTFALSAPPDDEIVLLSGDGHVIVVDPYHPAFIQPVRFTSPTGGWQRVRLGDINGDGDEEIVVQQGTKLRIYDPVVQPGSHSLTWEIEPPEGHWTALATGDVDRDGRDEIIAAHTSARPNVAARVLVIDVKPQGNTASILFAQDLDIPVLEMDTGDVDGDGWDDIVVLGDIRALFYIIQGGTWDPLYYYVELKPWVGLAVGQTHKSSSQEEIAVIRRVPQYQDSYWLYRWLGGNRLRLLDRMDFYPNMDDVAVADMNGDGDDELLFVRHDDTQVPVIVRNPDGYALPREIQLFAGPGWKRIAGGDLDGDGWGEVVILKERAYRIYTEPERSDAFVQHVSDYRLSVAVGNLDGPGIPAKPVLHLSANSVRFHYEAYTLPPAQAVLVTNVGGNGPIPWTAEITHGDAWLHIAPTSGTTPGTLVLSVEPRHLAAGVYTGTVRIVAEDALESPQTISVTLEVVTPILEVQPHTLSFEAQKGHPPLNHRLAIRNLGPGGDIPWQATILESPTWITVTPSAGTTPADLTVTINPVEMDIGLHVASIRITAEDPVVSNSPMTVTVVASIHPPIMEVTPTRIYMNVWPDEVYTPPRISIRQYGVPEGHAIHWVAGVIPGIQPRGPNRGTPIRVTSGGVIVRDGEQERFLPNLDWITLHPWEGITPSVMTVRVHNDTMPPGVYRATIIVDGGPETENRLQAVDVTVVIPAHQYHLPFLYNRVSTEATSARTRGAPWAH